jgi:hypothetical protein
VCGETSIGINHSRAQIQISGNFGYPTQFHQFDTVKTIAADWLMVLIAFIESKLQDAFKWQKG